MCRQSGPLLLSSGIIIFSYHSPYSLAATFSSNKSSGCVSLTNKSLILSSKKDDSFSATQLKPRFSTVIQHTAQQSLPQNLRTCRLVKE